MSQAIPQANVAARISFVSIASELQLGWLRCAETPYAYMQHTDLHVERNIRRNNIG